MPEMIPDPGLEWLARLRPNESVLDPADILFHAGRASARTPRPWKIGVAGLLLTNAVAVGLLLDHQDPRRPATAPAPVAVPTSSPAPTPPPASPPGADPNSVYSLARSLDPDAPPPPAGFVSPDRPTAPLTVGSLGATD
jgi:hypothetical protein